MGIKVSVTTTKPEIKTAPKPTSIFDGIIFRVDSSTRADSTSSIKLPTIYVVDEINQGWVLAENQLVGIIDPDDRLKSIYFRGNGKSTIAQLLKTNEIKRNWAGYTTESISIEEFSKKVNDVKKVINIDSRILPYITDDNIQAAVPTGGYKISEVTEAAVLYALVNDISYDEYGDPVYDFTMVTEPVEVDRPLIPVL